MCDDGFAGSDHLRRRNSAVGGERLADWEVWVRASSQSEHRALFLHGKPAELSMAIMRVGLCAGAMVAIVFVVAAVEIMDVLPGHAAR
jgi:hypothetical protein